MVVLCRLFPINGCTVLLVLCIRLYCTLFNLLSGGKVCSLNHLGIYAVHNVQVHGWMFFLIVVDIYLPVLIQTAQYTARFHKAVVTVSKKSCWPFFLMPLISFVHRCSRMLNFVRLYVCECCFSNFSLLSEHFLCAVDVTTVSIYVQSRLLVNWNGFSINISNFYHISVPDMKSHVLFTSTVRYLFVLLH